MTYAFQHNYKCDRCGKIGHTETESPGLTVMPDEWCRVHFYTAAGGSDDQHLCDDCMKIYRMYFEGRVTAFAELMAKADEWQRRAENAEHDVRCLMKEKEEIQRKWQILTSWSRSATMEHLLKQLAEMTEERDSYRRSCESYSTSIRDLQKIISKLQ